MKTSTSTTPTNARHEPEGTSWQLLFVIAVIVIGLVGIVLKGIGLF